MSFLNSSTSFTRLRIVDEIPRDLWPNIRDLLLKYAFQDIDNIAQERAYGWTSFDDMLDTNWEKSPIDKADYICFSLRLDTRRIPPAVLKKHTRLALMEEEKKLHELGKKFVPKERRTEIKKQVELMLLTRFLPIPAEFQVVWSTQRNMIYFASTQQKMLDLFEEHFVLTFNLRLEQLTPYSLSLQLLGDDISKNLDALEVTKFV